MQTTLVLAVK